MGIDSKQQQKKPYPSHVQAEVHVGKLDEISLPRTNCLPFK